MCTKALHALGLRSREELAEEVARSDRAAISTYRNDEGTEFNEAYYAFWRRYLKVRKVAEEIGLTYNEIEEARRRAERGVPFSQYGEVNIFLEYAEWWTRNLESHRPHLGAIEKCGQECAHCFRARSDIPINERLRMLSRCAPIFARLRGVTGLGAYVVYKAVEETVQAETERGSDVDINLAQRVLGLILGAGQADHSVFVSDADARISGLPAGVSETLAKAEKERTYAACEAVRREIEKAIPSGKVDLAKKSREAATLIPATESLVRLTLACASENLDRGMAEKAQELWSVGFSASEMLKAHLTGTKRLLGTKIGAAVRHAWPATAAAPFSGRMCGGLESRGTTQTAVHRQCLRVGPNDLGKWAHVKARDIGRVTGKDKSLSEHPSFPSTAKFVVLSFRFIGDDLVAFIDGSIGRFLYGDNFADYGYTPDKVLPEPLLCPLIVRSGVKQQIVQAVELLHEAARCRETAAKAFAVQVQELSRLVAIDEICRVLEKHCKKAGWAASELGLIVIPDGVLHAVPWSFLRPNSTDSGALLYRFGSVSTCMSLLVLKWSLMSHLYRGLPNLRREHPRCVFIGAPSTSVVPGAPYLAGVPREWQALRETFGPENTLAFGDGAAADTRATVDNIATYHRDCEVFWFAGHGVYEEGGALTIAGLRLPTMGLVLPDAVLHCATFYAGEPWNFNSSWVIVLNACLLGQLLEAGTEMTGLLAGLHLVGSVSVVCCLWEVNDGIAVEFAREFSRRLIRAYPTSSDERPFGRGFAFADTLRTLLKRHREVDLACYVFSGVP
ncbi:MAG: CHAT domain-containing protein [Planctomycetota bacterium]